MHLFTDKTFDINSYSDIHKIIDYILIHPEKHVSINFNKIEPLELKFQGTRFNQDYLPVEFFDVLKTFEVEYINFFSEVLKKDIKNANLFVQVKRSSLLDMFKGDIPPDVIELLKKLNSTDVLISVLFTILCWYGNSSYQEYLKEETKRLEILSNKEISQNALDIAKTALDALKENQQLERSKNRPIHQSLKMLNQEEKISFGIQNSTIDYTRNNDIDFNYSQIDNNEEKFHYSTVEDTFIIKGINEKRNKDKITIKSNVENAFEATLMLSYSEIHEIYKAKEKKETINLKVKIGRNKENKIKEAIVIEVMPKT